MSKEEKAKNALQETQDPATQPKSKGRSGAWWVFAGLHHSGKGIWRGTWAAIGATLTTLALILAVLVVLSRDRVIPISGKINEKLLSEINAFMPDAQVSWRSASVEISNEFLPRIFLTDVEFYQGDRPPFANIANMSVGFSLAQALSGAFAPKSIEIDGSTLSVVRDAEGQVALRFGSLETQGAQGVDLPTFLERIDEFLLWPENSNFSDLSFPSLTVQYDDLVSGRTWSVDGARIFADIKGQNLSIRGDMALLSGGADIATVELNYSSNVGTRDAIFGFRLDNVQAQDIASQSVALSWLSALDAPINGALRSGFDSDGQFLAMNATLNMPRGAIRPQETVRPIYFQDAKTYFTYDPGDQSLSFDTLSVKSRDLSFVAEGYAKFVDQSEIVSQFSVSSISANPLNVFDEDLKFDSAVVDLRLLLDQFQVEIPQVYLRNEAEDLSLTSNAVIKAADTGWSVAVNLFTDQINVDNVVHHWPSAIGAKARTWVSDRIAHGSAHDVAVTFRQASQKPPVTCVSFNFEDVQFKPVKFLPEVENAMGLLDLCQDRMAVLLNQGHITAAQGGQVDLAGSAFVVENTRAKPATAQTELKAAGTVTSILSVLNSEPLSVMTKAKLPVTLADGKAQVTAQITNKMKKGLTPKDISWSGEAVVTGARSTRLVPNRTVTAQRLIVKVDPSILRIEGPAKLDGVPFNVGFTSGLGKNTSQTPPQLLADFTLNRDALDGLGIRLPRDMISGATQASIVVDFPKNKPPGLTVTSALSGLEARMAFLGYRKRASQKGSFEMKAQLADTLKIDRLRFAANGLKFDGDVGVSAGKFSYLNFKTFQYGDIKVSGRYSSDGKLSITGGSLSLDRINTLGTRQSGGTASGLKQIDANLDRLALTKDLALYGLKAQITTAPKLKGNFSARLNKTGPLSGQISTAQQGIVIDVRSQNAGKTLSAAKLLKTGTGGILNLRLAQNVKDAYLDGFVTLTDIKIQDAPILAELFNIISIVGLLDQLNGPGLAITDAEARFRIKNSKLTVAKASAVGPSMGISIDGFHDLKTGALDMQGVISPLYILNGLGQVFTRKGEGLIGFSFNLKGSRDAPKLLVNPLSLLTPALFREIFRRPPPKLD